MHNFKGNIIRWQIVTKPLTVKPFKVRHVTPLMHSRSGRIASKLKFGRVCDFGIFCHHKLDEASSWLCIIVTPFGKYRYTRVVLSLFIRCYRKVEETKRKIVHGEHHPDNNFGNITKKQPNEKIKTNGSG